MPRPTTKPELIKAAGEQFEKMRKLIDSMTDDEQNAAFNFGDSASRKEAHWARDNDLRDVLVHLYEWHQLLLNWVKSNKNVKKSHSEVMTLIETFSNDELFTKGHFPWTGGSVLGSYCVSTTASHYDWAMKKIKLHIKTIK